MSFLLSLLDASLVLYAINPFLQATIDLSIRSDDFFLVLSALVCTASIICLCFLTPFAMFYIILGVVAIDQLLDIYTRNQLK